LIEKTTTAIAEYQPIAAALATIEKYRGLVVDVKTEHGMREAKAVLREVAVPRIALEKTRKQLKESVLERGRLIERRLAEEEATSKRAEEERLAAERRQLEEARAKFEAEQPSVRSAARSRSASTRGACSRRSASASATCTRNS
jgi:hypothetical protein